MAPGDGSVRGGSLHGEEDAQAGTAEDRGNGQHQAKHVANRPQAATAVGMQRLNAYLELAELAEEPPDRPACDPDLGDSHDSDVEERRQDDQRDHDQERAQRRGHLVEFVQQHVGEVPGGYDYRRHPYPPMVEPAIHFQRELVQALAAGGTVDHPVVVQSPQQPRRDLTKRQVDGEGQGGKHERRDRIHAEIPPEVWLVPDGLPVLHAQ
jgi:hypothetical protein